MPKNRLMSSRVDGYIFSLPKDREKFKEYEHYFPMLIFPEPAPEIDEVGMKITTAYCDEFGCGRKLKLVEKLAGKKCLKHQIKNRRYGDY